jgi:hypothetical protein
VGGQSNTASGQYAVAGGQTNVSSGKGSVALGLENQSTGEGSVALGRLNQSRGFGSVAVGYNNYITGNGSFVTGSGNQVTAGGCFAAGGQGYAYLTSQFVFGSSGNTAPIYEGTWQKSVVVPWKIATLTTGATSLIDSTGLLIPRGTNRVWNVQVNWVAVVTAITGTATGISVGDVVTSIDLLAFKKIGGTSSVSAHTSTATKTMVTNPL